jgi:diphosphomevalonate decarboxylase
MAKERSGQATFEASPNIALVKYWGKRDPLLGLPYNSSFSVTLDRFRTRTTVAFEEGRARDALLLNGRASEGGPREGVERFLDRVRELAGSSRHAIVRSENNFPTASGLASSASGFAALAGAAAAAAGLALSPRALSRLARLGSGSAARSIFGGFVEWRAGVRADGLDCYALPRAPAGHWPGLVDHVALVREAPVKAVRSADAMQATVATSPGYAARLAEIPDRLQRIRRAVARRDAEALFAATIEECDSFRSVCETTDPPLDYLTATSRAILAAVRAANAQAGRPIAAYTHDAGAHVHVFTLATELPALRRRLSRIPGVERWLTVRPGPAARRVARA